MGSEVVPDFGQSAPGVAAAKPPRTRPATTSVRGPPPLPRDLRRTGVGWLIGAVVAIIVTVLIFRNGVSGAAISIIVVDDTVVRWISGVDVPGVPGIARVVSYAASWWFIEITIWVLTVAMVILRRWRHLLIYLLVSQIAQFANAQLNDMATQPRPFGVPLRGSWEGWSLPSIQILSFSGR